MTRRPVEVDGGPGGVFVDAGQRLLGVWALQVDGGRIVGINSLVDPEKLQHLGPVGDFGAMLRGARLRISRSSVASRRPRGGFCRRSVVLLSP